MAYNKYYDVVGIQKPVAAELRDASSNRMDLFSQRLIAQKNYIIILIAVNARVLVSIDNMIATTTLS